MRKQTKALGRGLSYEFGLGFRYWWLSAKPSKICVFESSVENRTTVRDSQGNGWLYDVPDILSAA